MNKLSIQSQTNDYTNHQLASHIPLWVSIVVILGTLLTITGAVISKVDPTLLTNGNLTETTLVYADYTFARNLALAVMMLFLLGVRARRMLAGFMVLIALIQIVDVINDLTRGDFQIVPGLLVFAIVFLIGSWRLLGQAIWHVETWRDM